MTSDTPGAEPGDIQPLTHIYLYDEPDAAGLDVIEIGGFLTSIFPGARVETRRDFFTHQFARFGPEEQRQLEPEVVRQVEIARVHDLAGEYGALVGDPLAPEDLGLEFVFEAARFQAILRLLIDSAETGAEHLHIVLTNHALGVWPSDGERFRLGILFPGAPAILSLSGLVEALPRPREYDFRRAQMAILGVSEDALEDLALQFVDRTFGYTDPRINEICKGYALMACVQAMTGEDSCPDPDCRLHDAKSQEEMIRLQCASPALCDRHKALLSGLG